jgi:hypothetical protein
MHIRKTDARWYQQFKHEGKRIRNLKPLSLDVQGGKDVEGANVIVWNNNN